MTTNGCIHVEDHGGANTFVHYLYRDGSNYKSPGVVRLRGRVDYDLLRAALSNLDEGIYFVPGQVGFPDLQGRLTAYDGWTDDDHPFHELRGVEFADGVEGALDPDRIADEVFEAIRDAEWEWGYRPEVAGPSPA